MLVDVLRGKLTEARKSGNKSALTIIQVILGDVASQKYRLGSEPTDDQIETLIRGLREKNNETLAIIAGKGREPNEISLKEENDFLSTLLPVTLTVEEIKVALSEVAAIKEAKNDGQATGVAMKYLKPKGLKVLGDDVKKAVEELRKSSWTSKLDAHGCLALEEAINSCAASERCAYGFDISVRLTSSGEGELSKKLAEAGLLAGVCVDTVVVGHVVDQESLRRVANLPFVTEIQLSRPLFGETE